MPEKVEDKPAETDSVEKQPEQNEASGEQEQTEVQEEKNENGDMQDGGEKPKAEGKEEEGESSDAPKRRGRKPKQGSDGPDNKKPKKEAKTPERVSSRVRNRSVGEKLPEFKDMKDLPSPTRRKSKSDAKELEKPAASESEQVEATS